MSISLTQKEAMEHVYYICSCFVQWHCPSVSWDNLTEDVAQAICDFFGTHARREGTSVIVEGLLTEDNESG